MLKAFAICLAYENFLPIKRLDKIQLQIWFHLWSEPFSSTGCRVVNKRRGNSFHFFSFSSVIFKNQISFIFFKIGFEGFSRLILSRSWLVISVFRTLEPEGQS